MCKKELTKALESVLLNSINKAKVVWSDSAP